ncbi:MAG: MYXO-CTERM domain-containing protein, partial [Cognaticolwellia sp.]
SVVDTAPETGETGPADTGQDPNTGGCNCSPQNGSLAGLWGLALVGLFWRRRR